MSVAAAVSGLFGLFDLSSVSAQTVELPAVTVDAPATPTDQSMEVRDQAGGKERGYQPLTSSTATRTNAKLIDIPQSVAVVPNQVLKDQNVRTLDEALRNVSGINTSNTVAGTQDAFLKRGFGDNRDGSILRDGFRTILPNNFTQSVDRVEVLKGPSSMMYGVADPGGVVNLISKAPELTQHGSLSGNLTSFNGGGATGDITGPIGKEGFAYRLIADYQDANYWRNFGQIQRRMVSPSLAYYGATTTVKVNYEHTEYTLPYDRGTVIDPRTGQPIAVPRERRFDEPYSAAYGKTDLVSAVLEQQISTDWKIRFGAFYNQNTSHDASARVLTFNAATGATTRRSDQTDDSRLDNSIIRAEMLGKFNTFGIRHEIIFGTEYENTNVMRSNLIQGASTAGFNLYNPVYGALPLATTVAPAFSDQTERTRTTSGFVQDSIHLTESLIVVGGVRYQDYSQFAGRGRPFRINTDVNGSATVPRVGVVLKLRPDFSLYADYSESFKPNSSVSALLGALPPEQGRSYEVGAKVQLADGITATAAVFDIVKSNVLYTQIIAGTSFNSTAGRVGSKGFEFDIAGKLTDHWSVIASYSWIDAKVLEDPTLAGKRLANVSHDTASGFVTYDFGTFRDGSNLKIGVGGRYVGHRAGDPNNTFELPSYALADAYAAYRTTYGKVPATWQLNFKNIFDKTYYVSSLSNTVVSIGDPREVTLQVKLDF